MGHRIFLYVIVLGSLCYGALAVSSSVRTWQTLPRVVRILDAQATPAARSQAQYLRSPWYQGQLVLAWISGMLFLVGALGAAARQDWSRMTLYGAAWVALVHMAWMLISSLEWFHATRTGMLYQVNLLNVCWVLLMLAVMPTERMVRAWER